MSQGDLVHAPFNKFFHGCRLVFPDWLLPLRFLFLDALLPLGVGGSEDGAVFGVMVDVPETAWVSSRTLSFCFPLKANSLSSSNTA